MLVLTSCFRLHANYNKTPFRHFNSHPCSLQVWAKFRSSDGNLNSVSSVPAYLKAFNGTSALSNKVQFDFCRFCKSVFQKSPQTSPKQSSSSWLRICTALLVATSKRWWKGRAVTRLKNTTEEEKVTLICLCEQNYKPWDEITAKIVICLRKV